ncbi:MAG: XshC-Cox1-family protein [Clostridiales bacterium]|nr:XshC-Cox1-family protein [Clostridiales bacterium]
MNIYDEIVKAQNDKKDFAVLTIIKADGSVPRRENSKMIVFKNGDAIGTIGGGSLEKLSMDEAVKAIEIGESKLLEIKSNNSSGMVCGGKGEVFIEVHKLKPKLILCGAVHVNKAISYIADTVNFDITVIDSRPEWANKQRFPEANNIIIDEDMDVAVGKLSSNENTFFIIATWDHKWDKNVLRCALKKKHKYIGMIASRRKVEEIFSQLISEGVEQSSLDCVFTPVGLDIKAETPEEIAISVISEILMVKNCATGKSLSKVK